MNNISQPKQRERGQSMVELALTITILMVLLAGTIDLGRAFFTWLALRDAAQEGASYGSAVPAATLPMIETRVRETFSDVVPDLGADIDVFVNFQGPRCLGNAVPSTIEVVILYQNFPLPMPFLGTIVGGQTIPIKATIEDSIISPACH